MRTNPIRGTAFDVATEKNPRRPLYSSAEFKALRSVSDNHTTELRTRKPDTARGFDKARERSYMSELLDLAEGAARRIGAIVALRYSDLHLAKSKLAPYGSIQWPGDTDKEGREWSAPLSPRVRKAIDRILKERPGVGTGYLFPAPGNPTQPITTDLVTRWLKEVEDMAKVEHVEGRAWHALRRKWATERKNLPEVDVAAAGGWKSLEALKRSYQHAEAEGVLVVVLGEVRKAR